MVSLYPLTMICCNDNHHDSKWRINRAKFEPKIAVNRAPPP